MLRVRACIFATLVLAAAATTGCVRGPLDKQSEEMFLAGHRSFVDGDYRSADQKFSEVISRNPTSWALSEVHYFRGLARLRLGRRTEAKEDFRRGASLYGRELTQVYSAAALANLEHEEGNDTVAVHLYRQVLEHPVHGLPVDAVMYRLAVSLQRLGQWTEADELLAKLITEHPASSWAAAGRGRFQAAGFTIQVGAFADRRNAEAMADKVRAEGLPVAMGVAAVGGKTLHTVRVGKFKTYREAADAANDLRAKGYPALIKP